MKLSRSVLVLLVAALIVLPAIPTRAQQKPIALAGYPAVGSPPVVTILAPGAAPRVALRYKIPAGQKSVMEMTMGVGMNMNVGGMAVPMDMPPIIMAANIDVTNVAPNGDVTFDLAFTKVSIGAGADPTVAAAMEAASASITALKGSATVTSRGVTKSVKLDTSKVDPAMQQALGQMTSQFENMSMPLPEEAVGVGARWEVRQALTAGGMTMFQKAEYEVTAVDAGSVSVKVKIEQQAPPQPFNAAMMPPGTDATIEKMSGTGTGTMTIQMNGLVPTSTIETISSMAMAISGQSITSDTRLKMSITGRERK